MTRGILVIGLGQLGFDIAHLLSQTPNIGKIILADNNEESGTNRTENVVYTAAHQGFYPSIEFAKIDLSDVDRTAQQLTEIQPDLIINATTLMSWWVHHTLSRSTFEKVNEAGLGPQTPMHLALTYRLMLARKKAKCEALVVNCSYSDVVNPVLAKIGLAPTVGGGNMDLNTPKIRYLVSQKLKVPIQNVSVYLVGHHGLLTAWMQDEFWAKILVGDKDVSNKFPINLLRDYLYPKVKADMSGGETFRVPPNRDIAASFVKNALAIYFDRGIITNAPGPAGYPGCYPVRISAKGAEIYLPDGLTLREAIRINEKNAKRDGVEKIREDGTLVITDKAAKIVKDVFDFECKELRIQNSMEDAEALLAKFKKVLKR